MRQLPTRLRNLFTRRSVKSITLALACLMLAFVACTPATPTADTSLQQTQIALSVEQTVRAGEGQLPDDTQEPPDDQPPDIPPSATPSPTVTESPWVEGSVERASYDPKAGAGGPDIHDDFSGSNPEFQLDNSAGNAHGWYQNGRFNITFGRRGYWTWYTGNAELRDFYVDVVVYNGDQCSERDAAGLLFRQVFSIDFGLLFGVSCDGGYFVGITGGPGPGGVVCRLLNPALNHPSTVDCSGLWDHPTSEYIDPGPGAANRLGVRASGASISFYINGHQIDSIVLPAVFSYTGKFALYLGVGSGDTSVSFDDFSIWYVP